MQDEEQHLDNLEQEKHPEDMTTEELQAKVNGEDTDVEEDLQEENSQESEREEQENQDDTEEEETSNQEENDDTEEQEEDGKKKPSRREQLRINTLLEKYGNPDERKQEAPKDIDYRDMIDAEDTVYEQLEKKSSDYGKSQYEAGLRQAETIEWKTGLRIDSPQVAQKYKFLDKHSDEFDPAAADAMSRRYLQQVGYNPGNKAKGVPESVRNPGFSWTEFVEAEMELADRLASTRVEKTTKNLKRQVAKTGLRPDGSSVKTKRFEDMSIEEANDFVNRGLRKR